MKLAFALLSRIGRNASPEQDRFELRLRSMTSPSVTGPRLRRVMPPMLFGFRSRGEI